VTTGFAARDRLSLWTLVAAGERVCAFALLLILAPMLAVTGLIIWLLSRRAPLVAHARVGRNGKEFWVLKLRTMWGGSTVHWCPKSYLIERLFAAGAREVKSARDPRVTSTFAAFCRKYSIDELPQLYHVLRGEMSFVGPRPLTRDELSQYYGPAAREASPQARLDRPLASQGRSRLNYRQRRRLDLFLVRNWSFDSTCGSS
jgi:lipopolysaccharide/colanic/teichoic acid biosynthesis glycosyltransferase